jgi:hypothetical protein
MTTLMRAMIPMMAAAAALALAGCWPFGRSAPTPQQQFLDALNHGHSAEASQIWLNMSEEDRLKWAHSEGVAPSASPEEVKKRVIQHYEDEMGEGENDTSESIEQVSPELGGAGIQNLPAIGTSPESMPPEATPQELIRPGESE